WAFPRPPAPPASDRAVKLNLSDEPVTAELLAESLRRTGSAVLAIHGNSMHPTLQMGWRVFIEPVRGEDLRVGEIAVFRTERHLAVHRLVWRERHASSESLYFRGDYNRSRERVTPDAVIGRVVAVEVPGRTRAESRIRVLQADVLTRFYRLLHAIGSPLRPLARSSPPAGRVGPFGRGLRMLFAASERLVSLFLRPPR
ncbi:MAG TPA: S24/S26 family peptidase, partial [Candidatus Polarisedimenticolia bacterium]|nr:S24/S26 family peptidase [Candidatus Polarisedimenticolia bacterium]